MGILDVAGRADKQEVLFFYLVCVYIIKKKKSHNINAKSSTNGG